MELASLKTPRTGGPWQRFAGRDGGDGARGIDQDRARNFLVGDEVIEEDRGGAAVPSENVLRFMGALNCT